MNNAKLCDLWMLWNEDDQEWAEDGYGDIPTSLFAFRNQEAAETMALYLADEGNYRPVQIHSTGGKLVEHLSTAVELVRLKYGNLDADVVAFLKDADMTLAKARGQVMP